MGNTAAAVAAAADLINFKKRTTDESIQTQRAQRRGLHAHRDLIVVLILGILAALVLVQISGMRADAERAAFISSGQIFQEAASRYFLDNGAFPRDRRSGKAAGRVR